MKLQKKVKTHPGKWLNFSWKMMGWNLRTLELQFEIWSFISSVALYGWKSRCVDAFGYLVSIHHNIGYYEEEVMRNNGHFSFWLLTSRMSRLNFTLRPSFPFITFHRNLAPRATLLTNVGEFYYPYVIMCCEPRIDERRLQVSRSPHEFKNYSVPTQKFTKSQNAQ